ncbi:MAG: FHA domain-containing protein [Kofleriaceae bacterium]
MTDQQYIRTDVDTDPPSAWLVDPDVVRLREWGADPAHALTGSEVTLGSGPQADLRFVDPSGFLSRVHAKLTRTGDRWWINDLGSTNGTTVDTQPIMEVGAPLFAGVEVGIGKVSLVAESPRLIELRAYLARVLGWNPEHGPTIDLAIRAIRAASGRRAALILAGSHDVTCVARQIHRRTLGPAAPFVVWPPDRHEKAVPSNGASPIDRSRGGTLCVRPDRLREGEFQELSRDARIAGARVQLFISLGQGALRPSLVASSIIVPPLTSRPADIDRVVFECALDATNELGAELACFTAADRESVVRHAATSLEQIETTVLRIVAVRHEGNVHRAAKRLGLSHPGLGKWLKDLPFKV